MKSGMFNKWCAVIVCACAAMAAAEPARVIYVDSAAAGSNDGSSWQQPCKYLQDALASAAAAEKPVEIRVARGVYKPDQGTGITPGDRLATFKLVSGVTIKGGYAGAGATDPNARDTSLYETILSGDLAGNDDGTIRGYDDNSCHVVTASGTDHTTVIEGLTIAGGSTAILWPSLAQPDGGAGMLIDAASPMVLNCRFVDNYGQGREVLLARNGSQATVVNCAFLRNRGWDMGNRDRSNTTVTNCRFENSEWGAIQCFDSSPAITGCTFLGGLTAFQAWDCNSVLTDCVFTGTGGRMGQRGMSSSGGHLTLMGCTFTGFTDSAIDASNLTLVGCTFKDNSGFMTGAVHSVSVTALECTFVGNTGHNSGALWGRDIELHDCQFTGNKGPIAGAGAIMANSGGRLIATGCVFAGNWSQFGTGAIRGGSDIFKLSNCTFVGNRGRYNCLDARLSGLLPSQITQCIVRDGPEPFGPELPAGFRMRLDVSYSNVQGGCPGQGNIDVDPCFVDPGYWTDPEDPTKPVDPNDPNLVWITGDYHLKSQAGHWDRASQDWVCDDVTSRCIDAGDPNAPLGTEPFPNGGFINLGAYAGTAEASKSYFGKPVCESQIGGDINGDCVVDQADLDILQLHWLMEGTGRVNSPPTVTLLSPKDGDEFTDPAPIVLQCTACDADGTVIRVNYNFLWRWENGGGATGTTAIDPTDNWKRRWSWSDIRQDCTCTIWAEAMDNEGARTPSQKIQVTLHPKM